MKKAGDLTLDEISTIFGRLVREKGVTRQVLADEIRKIRIELWRRRYGMDKRAT